ncbi:unnamed protein product, partial [Prorocentrum cordatum]
ALIPRPCALAALAAPYLAALGHILADRLPDRRGLALEGALALGELALQSAVTRRQAAAHREAVEDTEVPARAIECEVCHECEVCVCTPCPAPVRCEEFSERCTPCPAPERCLEDAGPPVEPECEPAGVYLSEPVLGNLSTPVSCISSSARCPASRVASSLRAGAAQSRGSMAIVVPTTPWPGHMFVVFFEGDAWGHERVLVWPLAASTWVIYTAQGDFYVEDATLYEKVVSIEGPGERPPGLGAVDIVQFDRPIQRREFLDFMASAQLHAGVLQGARGLPDWPAPAQWATPERGPGAGDLRGDVMAGALSRAEGEQPPEVTWRVAEPGLAFGEMGAAAAGFRRAAARRLSEEEFKNQRLALFSPPTPRRPPEPAIALEAGAREAEAAGAGSPLNERTLGEPPPGAAATATNNEAATDARVLEVDWDAQGERHKDWKEVRRESTSHSFLDWPLDGVMKHIDRFGPMPTAWLEARGRRRHVAPSDRAYHQLRVLAESFEQSWCYDQVNMPCLAGIEVLMRRFQTLLEAHSVPGAKPNYSMASAYSGTAMLEDAAAPDLRIYGARRLKEKVLEESAQRGGLAAPQADGYGEDDPCAAGKGGKGSGDQQRRRGPKSRRQDQERQAWASSAPAGVMMEASGGGSGPAPAAFTRSCMGVHRRLPAFDIPSQAGAVSRRSRRRRGLSAEELRRKNETLDALHWRLGSRTSGPPGAAAFEKEAVANLVAPVIAKPVAAPSQEEAARVLLRGHLSSDAEETYTTVVPYDYGSVSLPEHVHDTAVVTKVPDADGRLIIEGWQKSTTRSTNEFDKLNERLGDIKLF